MQRLLRRRDVATMLGISESMVFNLERRGMLQPLRLDAIGRTVRYDAESVNALADRLIREARASSVPAVERG
jgi:predicted DNA-binding transcriptional regulator AlpA